MKWYTKLLLALLGILLIGAVWLALWARRDGQVWLDRTVRQRIEAAVDHAIVEGYHFRMDSLRTDFLSGDVHIAGIALTHVPALKDSLRNGVYDYLFAGETRMIELRGLSIWRAVLKGEVHLRSIDVEAPLLDYTIGERRVRLQEPFERLRKPGAKGPALFRVDHVIVRDAQASMEDLSGHLPVLRASGLNIDAAGVSVTHTGKRRSADLDVGLLDIAMDSLSTDLPGGYRLRLGAIALSDREQRGHVHHIALERTGQFAPTERTTALKVEVDSLTLRTPDIGALIGDKTLRVNELGLHGLRLLAELDKELPEPQRSPTLLPPAALLGLPFTILVDTVRIWNGAVAYHERSDATGLWGRVRFSALNATFSGLRNTGTPANASPVIEGRIECLFMDTARMQATYRAPLDGSDEFTFTATLNALPFASLDSLTSNLLRLSLVDGRVEHMHLAMNGNAEKARGTMELAYADLVTTVAANANSAQRRHMLGSIMDHILSPDKGGGLSDHRRRTVSIDRDVERSLLTYIWHFTRTGLKRDLTPGVKERITTLLRKDRSERKRRRR